MNEKDLKTVEKLTKRIHRLRGVLNDYTSPVQYITRPKGHNRAGFHQRVKTLRTLEIQRTNLLERLTGVPFRPASQSHEPL